MIDSELELLNKKYDNDNGMPKLNIEHSFSFTNNALDLDIEKGYINNLTKGVMISIEPLPPVMIKMLEDGGLVEHIKKNGDFKL